MSLLLSLQMKIILDNLADIVKMQVILNRNMRIFVAKYPLQTKTCEIVVIKAKMMQKAGQNH